MRKQKYIAIRYLFVILNSTSFLPTSTITTFCRTRSPVAMSIKALVSIGGGIFELFTFFSSHFPRFTFANFLDKVTFLIVGESRYIFTIVLDFRYPSRLAIIGDLFRINTVVFTFRIFYDSFLGITLNIRESILDTSTIICIPLTFFSKRIRNLIIIISLSKRLHLSSQLKVSKIYITRLININDLWLFFIKFLVDFCQFINVINNIFLNQLLCQCFH